MTVAPGRLFFVGDPKQSIYRFRRADIAQFMEVRRRLAEEPLQLTRNFRSVPGVVDWVNAVFGDLIGEGDPGRQPRFESLEPDRQPHHDDRFHPPVVVLGLDPTDDGDAADVRRRSAAEITTCIQRVVDDGWPVGERGEPAHFSDVTVLVPTRTSVPALERALEDAAIPYRLEAMSLVYSSAEVRDLMAVLRAVDDPTDEVSVVAALRSASMGCGDDDLLAFKEARGQWDYRADPPQMLGDAHPVVTGMRRLRALHEGRWWSDVSQLVELALREMRLYELALADRQARERWRRLRFVVDEARLFADAFGGDLRAYLRWADLQCDEQARVTEAVLPEADDDAVRIMTMHAAKGLEFPVVVLAGLGSKGRPNDTTGVLWGPGGYEVSIRKDLRTAGYDALEADGKEKDACERVRLLYVAATRARDHLVLALHRKAGTDCPAALLADACGAHPEGALWRELPPPGAGERSAVGADRGASSRHLAGEGETALEPDREEWRLGREALLAQADRPRTLAATVVARLARLGAADGEPDVDEPDLEEDDPSSEDEVDPARPSWRRGRAGTAVGRAVHATLQLVDLATGEGLEAVARARRRLRKECPTEP